MLPLSLPEPAPLLQAASVDSVMMAMASLPAELLQKPERHVVMFRGRRRVLLLENGTLRHAFPVAVGMPGWETPTGEFKVLEKIEVAKACKGDVACLTKKLDDEKSHVKVQAAHQLAQKTSTS